MNNPVEAKVKPMSQELVGFDSWHDPRLDSELLDYNRAVRELVANQNTNLLLDAAANLCETSRAILYRLPRINPHQARKVAEEFERAVAVIRELPFPNESVRSEALQFANHIQRRIDNLMGRKADASVVH